MKLLDEGLVRAIGTSNFKAAHLRRFLKLGLTPHLNQIQLDPWHRRDDLVALHRGHGIVTETWRPLGAGSALLQDPAILAIAKKTGRTSAQVVLRWAVQQGFVTAPKSSDPARMAQNLDVFSFSLDAEEISALDALGRDDPEMFDADRFGH